MGEGINVILTHVPKEDIKLFPLGTFKFKIKATRKNLNSQTGKFIEVPARKTIELKFLKESSNLLENITNG